MCSKKSNVNKEIHLASFYNIYNIQYEPKPEASEIGRQEAEDVKERGGIKYPRALSLVRLSPPSSTTYNKTYVGTAWKKEGIPIFPEFQHLCLLRGEEAQKAYCWVPIYVRYIDTHWRAWRSRRRNLEPLVSSDEITATGRYTLLWNKGKFTTKTVFALLLLVVDLETPQWLSNTDDRQRVYLFIATGVAIVVLVDGAKIQEDWGGNLPKVWGELSNYYRSGRAWYTYLSTYGVLAYVRPFRNHHQRPLFCNGYECNSAAGSFSPILWVSQAGEKSKQHASLPRTRFPQPCSSWRNDFRCHSIIILEGPPHAHLREDAGRTEQW